MKYEEEEDERTPELGRAVGVRAGTVLPVSSAVAGESESSKSYKAGLKRP